MARPAMYRLGLSLLVTWSTLRIILYGLLDRRPLLGFESADLQRSMFYHYGLRGHLDYTFVEQIARDGFKPPLWYGGVPLLFSWRDTLSSLDYLFINAAALLAAVWAVWILGRRVGGSSVAGWSVLCLCALPGVAGGVTVIGVETTHLAFVAWSAVLLLDLQRTDASFRRAAVAGLVLGLAMLAKWNVVVYLLLPTLWLLVAVRPARSGGWLPLARVLAALAIATLTFLLWLIPFAEVSEILAGSQGESTHLARWSAASLLYYPRELLLSSLGGAAALVALLALLGWWRARSEGPLDLEVGATLKFLVAVIASTLLVLTWFPHKEPRYLLPMYPALAVLFAYGLAACTRTLGRPGLAGVVVAAATLVAATLVVPWLQRSTAETDGDHHYRSLRTAPDASDYGLEAVVRHPSLREGGYAMVTYSFGGEAGLPIAATLPWELYGRNESPVISRYNHARVTMQSCRYDLVRSTHFVTNRVLSETELDTLTGLEYELRISTSPRVGSLNSLQLWQRIGRLAP